MDPFAAVGKESSGISTMGRNPNVILDAAMGMNIQVNMDAPMGLEVQRDRWIGDDVGEWPSRDESKEAGVLVNPLTKTKR
eukprot:1361277-Amorphochlora_amoeboformis.AAC.2